MQLRSRESVGIAALWGTAWAGYLQYTDLGAWLAEERTWLTVVIGVGGCLLIGQFTMDKREWFKIASIIAAASIGIITRSLWNEYGRPTFNFDVPLSEAAKSEAAKHARHR